MVFVALVVNVVWFGLGFRLFTLQAHKAVRLLVPKSAADEQSAKALVTAMPFLGGMNFAFATLSCGAIVAAGTGHAVSTWLVCLASAAAHASQFLTNLPLALVGGRAGGASWDVLRGPMSFIFVVDGLAALVNVAALF